MCIPEHLIPTPFEPSFEAPETPWGLGRSPDPIEARLTEVDFVSGTDQTAVAIFTREQLEQIARNTAHGVMETGTDADSWKIDRHVLRELRDLAKESVMRAYAASEIRDYWEEKPVKAETDPAGRDPHTPGAKLDAGKNRLGLVLRGFARALVLVGEVGTYGARKYTPNGWKEVPDGEERYMDAAFRHIFEDALEPLDRDPEADTDLQHLAQTVWNLLAVLEFRIRNETHKRVTR